MTPKIELLTSLALADFPSGSSINYRDEKLYLIGDDANTILILDKDYHRINSKQLFNYPDKRIPKPLKADLEASTVVTIQETDHLLIVGSASTPQREKVFLVPFSKSDLDIAHFRVITMEGFVNRLKSNGIKEINLEGITVVGKNLVLSNRGNRKNHANHLLITDSDFWKNDGEVNLKILPIQIPSPVDETLGVSELCYVEATDMLMMTLSTELTDNTYDDGAIGDSYIGWITDMSKKIQDHSVRMDQLINLSDIHADFKKEKMEGLSVESVLADTMILHLISDNDQGESKLFKVRMTYKA